MVIDGKDYECGGDCGDDDDDDASHKIRLCYRNV